MELAHEAKTSCRSLMDLASHTPLQQTRSSMSRKWFLLLLRFTLSCGVLCAVLSRLEYSQLLSFLPNLAVPFVTLSLVLVLLDRVLMAFRWHILLKAKGVFIPMAEVLRLYLVTGFLGMFMPSSVAPDFMRAYLAMKFHCAGGIALSSVFWDRFIAFVTLSFVASGSCLVLWGSGDSGLVSPSLMGIVFGLLAASFLFVVTYKYFLQLFGRVSFLKKFESAYGLLKSFNVYFISYMDDTSDLIEVACLSFVNHGVFILTVYFVTLSLNLEISLLRLCLFIPLITFITILPLSVNGIGLQEGAYVYLLSRSGLSVQEAFAVALLVRIVATMGCLPGAILYLSGGFETRKITVV
jgi:glycosyltransferase 2 family protein